MKDSYSLRPRRRRASTRSYELHVEAYDRIFDRAGLEWYRVESDVGHDGRRRRARVHGAVRGGRERRRALGRRLRRQRRGRQRDAAAGRRAARSRSARPSAVDTPGATHRSSRSREAARRARRRADQGVPGDRRGARAGARARARRPPAQRDQAPERARGAAPGPPRRTSCGALFGASAGFIGPVGARVDVLADEALRGLHGLVAGANEPDRTCAASSRGATSSPTWVDVRTRRGGRPLPERRRDPHRARDRGRQHLQARHALLRAARRALPRRARQGAADLDGLLRDRPGPHRGGGDRAVRRRAGHLVAARAGAVRRRAGRRSARRARRPARSPTASTSELREARPRRALRRPRRAARARSSPTPSCSAARCGSRSASAGLEAGEVEAQVRRGQEKRSLPLDGAAEAAAELWRDAPLSRSGQRLAPALSASTAPAGPPPRDAGASSRCSPWTIPNAIGFVRIALLPVFLVLALELRRRARRHRGDPLRRHRLAATTSTAWLARITGQYSRLGALLDPLTDRVLVLSGRDRGLALRAAAALGARRAGRARGVHAGADPGRAAARDRPQASTCSAAGRSGR